MARKKTWSIASAIVIALVAFTAPAAAQAEGEFWYSDPGEVKLGGEEEATSIEGEGELAWTDFESGFTSGPCPVAIDGELWNGEVNGEGRITSFKVAASHEKPCPTSFSGIGCNLATATAEPIPWISLTPGEKVTFILSASFTNRFTGCSAIGIPDNAPITIGPGNLTGEMKNESMVFENAGDLSHAFPQFGIVTVDAEIEIPGITAR